MPRDSSDYTDVERALLIPLQAENNDSSSAGILYGKYMRMQDVWEGMIAREHSFRRAQASDRVTSIFIWVMNEHQRTGTYPKVLTGPSSIDPYSGESLKYEKSSKGFQVYSLGPGGKGLNSPKGDLIVAQFP